MISVTICAEKDGEAPYTVHAGVVDDRDVFCKLTVMFALSEFMSFEILELTNDRVMVRYANYDNYGLELLRQFSAPAKEYCFSYEFTPADMYGEATWLATLVWAFACTKPAICSEAVSTYAEERSRREPAARV